MDILLKPGWQAKIQVGYSLNGLKLLFKTYNIKPTYNNRILSHFIVDIEKFQSWLRSMGIRTANNKIPMSIVMSSNSKFSIVMVQEYLGPDVETLLLKFFREGSKSEIQKLVKKLFAAVIKITESGNKLKYRVDFKPRNFCILNKHLILIDTFPPVLTTVGNVLKVATPNNINRIVHRKQLQEVLLVTGSPLGIFLNLIEHIYAISPKETNWLRILINKEISCLDHALSSDLKTALLRPRSLKKIQTLRNAVNKLNQ